MVINGKKLTEDITWPDKIEAKPPAEWDSDLTIRYVTSSNKDFESLAFNLLSFGLLFILLAWLVTFVTIKMFWVIAIPAIVVWIIATSLKLWTTVDARKASVFLDYWRSNRITVYTQGFHFVPWTAKKQEDEIDFQKHHLISMKRSEKSEARFQTPNGYELAADLTIFYNLREGAEAMSRALKYRKDEIEALVKAFIISRLSDLGGCNSFEQLLRNKAEVSLWIADAFDGEQDLSQFELGLGISLRNPILDNLDLTEQSKENYRTKAKLDVIKDGIAALIKDGKLTPEEANFAVQAAQGNLTREVHTYQGIPQNATVVALGDHGAAIALNPKKK